MGNPLVGKGDTMPFPLLAIPAIAGGLGALFKMLGKEKPGEFKQSQRFTPQQQQALNSVLQQAMSGLGQDPGKGFDPIAQQARTQFGQQTAPSIAERFSGLGSGAQQSSAFGQQLGQAGADLEGQLASGRAQFGQQEQQQLMQMLNMGLTPQFDQMYQQARPGNLQNFGSALSDIGGATFGPTMGYMQSQNQMDRLPDIFKAMKGM